jgi:hypothetical protein
VDATAPNPDGDTFAPPDTGPSGDSATVESGSPVSDSGMPDAPFDPCDQDRDGYRVVGPACGGTDCCDVDARVHPGQTSFFEASNYCGSFDYNCDGRETPEYGKANCMLGWFACSGDGFSDPSVKCGDTGTFTACAYMAVAACSMSDSTKIQPCN